MVDYINSNFAGMFGYMPDCIETYIIDLIKQGTQLLIPLQNVSPTISYTGPAVVSEWTTTFNSNGGELIVYMMFSAYSSQQGVAIFDLMIDDNVATSLRFYFNAINTHLPVTTIAYKTILPAGPHKIGLRIPVNVFVDANDAATIQIIQKTP